MSKSAKSKKSKVPKLTEAEYAAYISGLKDSDETPLPTPRCGVKKQNGERLSPQ